MALWTRPSTVYLYMSVSISTVGCSVSNTAHAQFILKMAAVQGGLVDTVDKKDIKLEPSEDGTGNNNNVNDNRMLSPSPSSSTSSGTNNNNNSGTGTTVDQQTLMAVLQFLRKNKLNDSVDILRREAGLPEDSLNVKGGDPGAEGAAGNAELEGVDAATLLNRVTVSASAATQLPAKGRRAFSKYMDSKTIDVNTVQSTKKYCLKMF